MSSVPECPICLGPLSNRAVIDPCRHDFDYDCIKSWTNVNSNCPVCRCPVKYIHYSIVSDREYSVEKVKPVLAQDVPLPSDEDSDLDHESDYATDMDDDHYGGHFDEDQDIDLDSDSDDDDDEIFATDGSSDEWEDLSDASAVVSEGEYQEADGEGNESVQIMGAIGGDGHDDTFDTVGTVTLDSSDQEHFDDDRPSTPGDDPDYVDPDYVDGDDPDYVDPDYVDGDELEQEVEESDVEEEDREIYQEIPDSDLDDPHLDGTELYGDLEDDEWEDANGYDDDDW